MCAQTTPIVRNVSDDLNFTLSNAIEYLQEYYSRADNDTYFFLAYLDRGGHFVQRGFKVKELYENPSVIEEFIEQNLDKNLYYSINTFKSAKRSAREVANILALQFDFDLKRPVTTEELEKIVEVIEDFESATGLRVTVIKSGGGVQVLILPDRQITLGDFISTEQFNELYGKYGPELRGADEELYRIADSNMKKILGILGDRFAEEFAVKGLAIEVDSAVYDFARVMRLPYTYNMKYSEPIRTELIQYNINEYSKVKEMLDYLLSELGVANVSDGGNISSNIIISIDDDRVRRLIETIEKYDIYRAGISRSAVTLHLAALLHKRTNITYEEFEKILDAIHNHFNVEPVKRREKYAEARAVFNAEKERVASLYWLIQVTPALAQAWGISEEEAIEKIRNYHREVKRIFNIADVDNLWRHFKQLEEQSQEHYIIGRVVISDKDIEQLRNVIRSAIEIVDEKVGLNNITYELVVRLVIRKLRASADIDKNILVKLFKDFENFSVAYDIIEEELAGDNTNFAEVVVKYTNYLQVDSEKLATLKRTLRRLIHDIDAVLLQQTAQKIRKITVKELISTISAVYIYNDIIRIELRGIGDIEFDYKYSIKKTKVGDEVHYIANFDDNFRKLADTLYKNYGLKIEHATEDEVRELFSYIESIAYKVNMDLYSIDAITILYDLLITNIHKYQYYLELTSKNEDIFFKVVNARDGRKYIAIPKPLLEKILTNSALTEKEKSIVLRASDKVQKANFGGKRLHAFMYNAERFKEIGVDIIEELNRLAEERASDYRMLQEEGLIDSLFAGGGSE
ncbi:hypothetical protein TON_1379 [Thermococcus onnurineus NA1]|uniref:Uncharacterized protein n=1 Tax=Thermococcus onnurineus (strain NA1) TaxID=523850 RepID=B6YXQ6_THEON|nr:hypothetical protein [Thermococcus onnurineus]ACJ16869.1 hypothetical protein TON_1379 [Thermococcus onnurineus NA1]